MIPPPPAPALPLPGAARRSSPWRGTTPWQRTARRALARSGPSWRTGCRGRVAMGQERAHAEFVGQGHSLTVIVCSRLGHRRMALRSDVAEEPEGPCLMSPFLVLTADFES